MKDNITIGFSGSRSITSLTPQDKKLVQLATTVIHGGAVGYDTLINDYAMSLHKIVIPYLPKNPGIKKDYYERNKRIVKDADYMVFQWDGKSPGTKMTMDLGAEKKEREGK